jgi:hypothetical protein
MNIGLNQKYFQREIKMTHQDLRNLLEYSGILCRVSVKGNTLIIKVHPRLMERVRSAIRGKLPLGVYLDIKPMRMWDYWKCRKELVVIEER